MLQLYPLSQLQDLPSIVESNLVARRSPIPADKDGLVTYIGQYFPLIGIDSSVDQLIRVLSHMHRRFISNQDPSLFHEGLQLLRAVGCPGAGKTTLLRCIWGLLLHRIKEVRESDSELWEQWQTWQVNQLEDRILAWEGRPWVFLLSMETSGGCAATTAWQDSLPCLSCGCQWRPAY